ncbi:late embryogenesis abundant (LEA) hydroxyproline-rich glycoprotein family [Tasmannia lanceolata]|uniref:late embryogenesis abundant (LEA) hydroxyproline-rich glycoprotein family n=1 Tax=Tasmannia lanceolata TaxID=3420 RepID=UPI004063479F
MLSITPQPQKETKPNTLYLLPPPPNHTRKTMNQETPESRLLGGKTRKAPRSLTGKTSKAVLLRPPHRTNGFIWCGAIVCFIFSIILILAGISTLIVFLVIKPKYPSFETTSASLNSIYIDSPEYFNGDLTILANFSNPNRKIDIRYEYLVIELYFHNRLIATQALQPFTLRKGEVRLEAVHMVSSLVYLPLNLALELQKQVQSNRVWYNIRGTFRIRAILGLGHFSYWLYGRCQMDLTSPPSGVLVARSCRTKR